MLIARVCPIMSVYKKHGGQRGYRGHALNLPQDIQSFLMCHGVTLTEAFKHFVKFAEKLPNGKYKWKFASHPKFPYWALDMKQRHQLLSHSNVYLHQHPADPKRTVEELREMVDSMSGKKMVNWLQQYVSKVQGTNPYMYQCLQEL